MAETKRKIFCYNYNYNNLLVEKVSEDSKIILNSNYLICDNSFIYAGRHILFDFIGSPFINDSEKIEKELTKSVKLTGAKILHSHFHKFGENCGITGVLVLEESHASVHTWTESNLMTFDIYMCGYCNPEIAYEYLKYALQPKEIQVLFTRRGIISKMS